jgi:hypothetical protein
MVLNKNQALALLGFGVNPVHPANPCNILCLCGETSVHRPFASLSRDAKLKRKEISYWF